MEEVIIQRVWKNKGANQKLVTIPKGSNIKEGDYVKINQLNQEAFKKVVEHIVQKDIKEVEKELENEAQN